MANNLLELSSQIDFSGLPDKKKKKQAIPDSIVSQIDFSKLPDKKTPTETEVSDLQQKLSKESDQIDLSGLPDKKQETEGTAGFGVPLSTLKRIQETGKPEIVQRPDTETLDQKLNTPLIPVKSIAGTILKEGSKFVGLSPDVVREELPKTVGFTKGVSELIEGLTTPENLALLGTIPLIPFKTVQRVISGGFGVLMAKQLPDLFNAYKKELKNDNPEEAARLGTLLIGTGIFSAAGFAGAFKGKTSAKIDAIGKELAKPEVKIPEEIKVAADTLKKAQEPAAPPVVEPPPAPELPLVQEKPPTIAPEGVEQAPVEPGAIEQAKIPLEAEKPPIPPVSAPLEPLTPELKAVSDQIDFSKIPDKTESKPPAIQEPVISPVGLKNDVIPKEPFEMTRSEFEKNVPITPISKNEASNLVEGGKRFRFDVPSDVEDIVGYAHKRNIQKALSEGKQVPPEVLAEYPDLEAQKYGGEPIKSKPKKSKGAEGAVQTLKRIGGVNPDLPESSDIRELGRIDLIRKNGRSLDSAVEFFIEDGRLPQESTGRDLIDLLDKEIKTGVKQLALSDMNEENFQMPVEKMDIKNIDKEINEIQGTLGQGKLRKADQIRLSDLINERLRKEESLTDFSVEAFGAPARSIPTGRRIEVAPITGVEPKPLSDIIFDASKGLGQKVFIGKPIEGKPFAKFAGAYYPGTSKLVIKYAGDLDTTSHELAHSLDDKFGIVAQWNKPGMESPFDNELAKFWQFGSVTESGPHSTLQYKRGEGVAEYIRALIMNPETTVKEAPQFSKFVQEVIPKEVIGKIKSFSNDVRIFAGATAHQQIMSNVQFKPPDDSILRFFSGSNIGPGFKLTLGDRMTVALQDNLRPFMKAIEFAKGEKGITELLPERDPRLLARNFMGMHAKVDDIFDHGMIDSKNNRVTKGGLKYILGSFDQSNYKSLLSDLQETISFMISERTIEKAEKLQKPGQLDFIKRAQKKISGAGGGIETDLGVALRRIEELKQNPEKFKRIQEGAKRYREWADSLLRYLKDKGRISQESYDQIKKNNEYYVAMNRVMETAPNEEIVLSTGKGGGGIGSAADLIKRFKGSAREILNPYNSLMESTYRTIREADRNEVMKVFRDLLVSDRDMGQGKVFDLASVGRKAVSSDKNTITIFVDGNPEHWQFQADIFKSLKGINDGKFVLPGWMTILPRIARTTIVNFPAFAVRNFIRDSFERVVLTETNSKLLDGFKAAGEMAESNLKLFGGDQAGHYLRTKVDYMRAMDTALKELAKDKNNVLVSPSKLAKGYEGMIQQSEFRNRIAEYNSAFRFAKEVKKLDDYNAGLYAASKARELMDFAVSGNIINTINQMVPFTNASIQGLTRIVRVGMNRPGAFTSKWITYILAPTLFEIIYNKTHNEEEYNQQPAYIKDMFWNFKVSPNHWLRIPKPFEMGVAATGVSRALNSLSGTEHSFEGYGNSVARSLLPVDESALSGPFRGTIQAIANWDFFKNKNIVPPDQNKLDLELRSTQNASRLGQFLQVGLGVDARKIDFLMGEMFGNAGRLASNLSDVGRKDKPSGLITQTGIIIQSPAYAAKDVQFVMNTAAQRGLTNRNDFKGMMKLLNAYWDAPTEKKDEAAKILRERASEIRKVWESNPQILENAKQQRKNEIKILKRKIREGIQ